MVSMSPYMSFQPSSVFLSRVLEMICWASGRSVCSASSEFGISPVCCGLLRLWWLVLLSGTFPLMGTLPADSKVNKSVSWFSPCSMSNRVVVEQLIKGIPLVFNLKNVGNRGCQGQSVSELNSDADLILQPLIEKPGQTSV